MLLPTDKLNHAITEDASQQMSVRYDEPFLAMLRNRDPQAFDRMVLEQAPQIQQLVSRLLGWDADAEDIVQEVFVAAWERMDRFRGEATIGTWLYSIAINQCRKQRRRRGRWRQVLQGLREREILETGQADRVTTDVAAVHEAIQQLPYRDRELIVLCTLEQKTLDETAGLLAIRKNTLEVRLHRARKKLKDILKQTLDE